MYALHNTRTENVYATNHSTSIHWGWRGGEEKRKKMPIFFLFSSSPLHPLSYAIHILSFKRNTSVHCHTWMMSMTRLPHTTLMSLHHDVIAYCDVITLWCHYIIIVMSSHYHNTSVYHKQSTLNLFEDRWLCEVSYRSSQKNGPRTCGPLYMLYEQVHIKHSSFWKVGQIFIWQACTAVPGWCLWWSLGRASAPRTSVHLPSLACQLWWNKKRQNEKKIENLRWRRTCQGEREWH